MYYYYQRAIGYLCSMPNPLVIRTIEVASWEYREDSPDDRKFVVAVRVGSHTIG